MDLYNLEIISFSISPTPSAEAILSAQQQAIEKLLMLSIGGHFILTVVGVTK